jgi:E3 ubiquitin-protein ligase EDD1
MGLSACGVRASVFTESNKVATWVDETLNSVASKLEHSAQTFPEFQTDKIVSLHTCSLYTCARLESSALYWWGIMPFGQRKKMLEKTKKKKTKDGSFTSDVSAGSLVSKNIYCKYYKGSDARDVSAGYPVIKSVLRFDVDVCECTDV